MLPRALKKGCGAKKKRFFSAQFFFREIGGCNVRAGAIKCFLPPFPPPPPTTTTIRRKTDCVGLLHAASYINIAGKKLTGGWKHDVSDFFPPGRFSKKCVVMCGSMISGLFQFPLSFFFSNLCAHEHFPYLLKYTGLDFNGGAQSFVPFPQA